MVVLNSSPFNSALVGLPVTRNIIDVIPYRYGIRSTTELNLPKRSTPFSFSARVRPLLLCPLLVLEKVGESSAIQYILSTWSSNPTKQVQRTSG